LEHTTSYADLICIPESVAAAVWCHTVCVYPAQASHRASARHRWMPENPVQNIYWQFLHIMFSVSMVSILDNISKDAW